VVVKTHAYLTLGWRLQTDNKDPDIVEQALSKVMQALKGSAGGKDAVPPQLPSPDQTVAIVDGVVKCLAHDNPRVRGAAVLWYPAPRLALARLPLE
jgi:hypothetical protein